VPVDVDCTYVVRVRSASVARRRIPAAVCRAQELLGAALQVGVAVDCRALVRGPTLGANWQLKLKPRLLGDVCGGEEGECDGWGLLGRTIGAGGPTGREPNALG
jgi:hypothetical protein